MKERLAELWARLKAWAHTVPPDVWIGLAIAAATLLVVWLAYRKAGGSSSSTSSTPDGTSVSSPVTGSSNTPGTTPLSSLSSGDVLTPGMFDLSQLWSAAKPNFSTDGTKDTGPVAHVTTDTLMATLNQNESNSQNVAIKALQAVQARAAATAAYFQNASPLDESQIAARSANTLTLPAMPSPAPAIQSYQQSEIASWTAPLSPATIPHPIEAIQNAIRSATTPTQKQQTIETIQYARQSRLGG